MKQSFTDILSTLNEELIQFADTLHPSIWDENNQLLPEVKHKLMKAAYEWYSAIDMHWLISDVIVTGSMANYTYNEHSDLDLHLVFDLEDTHIDEEFFSAFMFTKMASFNKSHNIKIKGIPVEFGFELTQRPSVATSSYSIINDRWIKEPVKPTDEIEAVVDTPLYKNIKEYILSELSQENNLSSIKSILDGLYNMRKDSLRDYGEFGKGNLIYKQLRNDGIVMKCKQYIIDETDKNLSLT